MGIFGHDGASERSVGESAERYLPQFDVFARKLMAKRLPQGALVLGLAALVLWPLDWLLLDSDSLHASVLGDFRVAAIAVCFGFVVLARATTWVRQAPALTASLAGIFGLFLLNWVSSDLGGLETPWFHSFAFISMLTIPVLVRLHLRIVVAVLISAAAALGYFLRNPSYLDYPFVGATLGQFGVGIIFSVLIGHGVYHLLFLVFVQRSRVAEQQDELATLNATLEDRVAEQTRELRALTRRIETVVDEERRFIAREIHDQLGQELTAIRLSLAYANKLTVPDQKEVRAALNDVEHLLGHTRVTMRRIMARLRPEVLEQLGIAGAAKWAIDDLASRMDIETTFELENEDLSVDREVADTLFYVLQEALTNIARHSEASSVVVKLERQRGRIRLVIADDGIGLPDGKAAPTSVGMIGIRERTAAVGGVAKWSRTSRSGGVTLEVSLPV